MVSTSLRKESLVHRIFEDERDEYIHPNPASWEADPLFRCLAKKQSKGLPNFTEREGIRARIIVKLRAGDRTRGVMFVSFRSEREFDQYALDAVAAYARLAAVALERAHALALVQVEREEIASLLHEGVAANFRGLRAIVTTLLETTTLNDRHREGLSLAREMIDEMRGQVTYIRYSSIPGADSEHFETSVRRVVAAAERAYGVEVRLFIGGKLDAIPPFVARLFTAVLRESLSNAVRHGHAHRATVDLALEPAAMAIRIEDDGCGFSVSRVTLRGLQAVRDRLERLNGSLDVDSSPGLGTRVRAVLPMAVRTPVGRTPPGARYRHE